MNMSGGSGGAVGLPGNGGDDRSAAGAPAGTDSIVTGLS
jgi:hypothetical protein